MLARTGSVRIWHWAHVERNPHCEAARETEWHLAWKVLGLDGTQEVKVGNRRADVLAPGGYAVEFQASALPGEEVRAREDDWATQGGIAWLFRADQARIEVGGLYLPEWLHLLKPENQATIRITWPRAPERVRAARAPSFLDIGNGELLFVGGWDRDSSPLAGWGWKVTKNWVIENLLRADQVPALLADDPADVFRRIDVWLRAQRERELECQREVYIRRQARAARLAARDGPWQERRRVDRGSCEVVLRAVEDLLKTGPVGFTDRSCGRCAITRTR
jgi:Competence protein CoiA-like family